MDPIAGESNRRRNSKWVGCSKQIIPVKKNGRVANNANAASKKLSEDMKTERTCTVYIHYRFILVIVLLSIMTLFIPPSCLP